VFILSRKSKGLEEADARHELVRIPLSAVHSLAYAVLPKHSELSSQRPENLPDELSSHWLDNLNRLVELPLSHGRARPMQPSTAPAPLKDA
jgi:hypothetical protein